MTAFIPASTKLVFVMMRHHVRQRKVCLRTTAIWFLRHAHTQRQGTVDYLGITLAVELVVHKRIQLHHPSQALFVAYGIAMNHRSRCGAHRTAAFQAATSQILHLFRATALGSPW